MSYWIFQNNLEHWDLRVELIEGRELAHTVSRYGDQMTPRDIVFFWLAGPKSIRGLYGWGTLTSTPYWDIKRQEDVVEAKYEKRLRKPILVTEIKSVRELQGLSILRYAQGSNFVVSLPEARAIASLIEPDQRPPVRVI